MHIRSCYIYSVVRITQEQNLCSLFQIHFPDHTEIGKPDV